MMTQSRAVMEKAKAMFKKCGANGWVKKVDRELSEFVV